ncbi:major capsid protein [Sigmofec virus UA08Rod_5342]|uniref:Major capsid protein n=1 Tax=Sigmofec virus UA08Rod_5342 TaxID=2929420 RepID=A0A976N298_9VIRU|nr:major capsid protein [Sigmofec virus UA08Rod_5342]
MANRYTQITADSPRSRFSQAVAGELVFSRMPLSKTHLTTFNAGEIVPIYCNEVLPNETLSMSLDFVLRQTTLLKPTMGSMEVDFYAFFVPNRIVNHSWNTVMGENVNGSWTASSVSLAPLFDPTKHSGSSPVSAVQIPVGSVGDHYGLPTQAPIPVGVLSEMNDLRFRGYIEIYNQYFRDQNYQPPIPYSKLNVYGNFTGAPVPGSGIALGSIGANTPQDNSYGSGAIAQAILGNFPPNNQINVSRLATVGGAVSAKSPLLVANKFHDYFTSVLPSPQKSSANVFVPVAFSKDSTAPVMTSNTDRMPLSSEATLHWRSLTGFSSVGIRALGSNFTTNGFGGATVALPSSVAPESTNVLPVNLVADLASASGAFDISELRMASAIQQVYEAMARGGSRYREIVRQFFGLDVEDPYKDVPEELGRFSRSLELFQTAQTSSSQENGTPQGNLAAFGYTSNGGKLFTRTFLEHGYVHVFAVVRHRNIYSSFIARDWFRRSLLDYYMPQLANVSEQPVYTREINPYSGDPDGVFGYQEAWSEYRYEPDTVCGLMRPGVTGSLAQWNYADDFNSLLSIATGEWLKSNSKEVLDRTLSVTSELEPQILGQFVFRIDKTLPMPTYTVPGMDVI